ncbi:hypothetical protein BC826DRAFT_1010379 [Russula brevipes]|nr:hypothetical protein BC826DRAFT_1010379 [Russula brevipes]
MISSSSYGREHLSFSPSVSAHGRWIPPCRLSEPPTKFLGQFASAFDLAHLYQVTPPGSSTGLVLPFPSHMRTYSDITATMSASIYPSNWSEVLPSQVRADSCVFCRRVKEKWCLPWAVELLPGPLHACVFLFFAGLASPYFCLGSTIPVSSQPSICVGGSGLSCILIFFLSLVRRDCPYHARSPYLVDS